MKNMLKNRLALSTVVTTLIILVVSVLLAGVVTYFAINVVSTRVEEESVIVQKQHVWCSEDNVAAAAFMLTNTGGRDVVLSKIACRGQDSDIATEVFYAVAEAGDDLTMDLNYTAGVTIAANDTVGDFTNKLAVPAGTNIVLTSGSTIAVYINTPDSISVNDIGLTVALTVFTSQAMYYKETNVEAIM